VAVDSPLVVRLLDSAESDESLASSGSGTGALELCRLRFFLPLVMTLEAPATEKLNTGRLY